MHDLDALRESLLQRESKRSLTRRSAARKRHDDGMFDGHDEAAQLEVNV